MPTVKERMDEHPSWNNISVGISLPKEMMDWIDSERGDVSRSRWILRMIEAAFAER